MTTRNLVLEGGGVKGIAYAGATVALEEAGIMDGIIRCAGTSAGAIAATLIAMRYSGAELYGVLRATDWKSFLDHDFGPDRALRLIKKFGLYKGQVFREWMVDQIARKCGGNGHIHFADMEGFGFRELTIIGADISTHSLVRFSAKETPMWRVADAVRVSMSIPFFFAAVRGEDTHVYVDGGAIDNFPIRLYDEICQKEETLGIRLDSAPEIAVYRDRAAPPVHVIDDLSDFIRHLAKTATSMGLQGARHLDSEDWKRTAYIDTLGIGATDFDISEADCERLVESGKLGITEYLRRP